MIADVDLVRSIVLQRLTETCAFLIKDKVVIGDFQPNI